MHIGNVTIKELELEYIYRNLKVILNHNKTMCISILYGAYL